MNQTTMHQPSKIGVLYGGLSGEREVSLNSGKAICDALISKGYHAECFDWHPHKIAQLIDKKYDAVFVALHGGSGENGEIAALLSMLEIPYTGCGVLTSAICMDKVRSLNFLDRDVLPAPRSLICEKEILKTMSLQDLEKNISAIDYPLVVKPNCEGSSLGVSIVDDISQLKDAIDSAFKGNGDYIILEQYIKGHELTCAVCDGKALGVCQIVPKNRFYDYEAKYIKHDTEYKIPTDFGEDFDRKIMLIAEKLYKDFGCHGIVRLDLLADSALNPYFLEFNTVPGMTETSLVPKIARAAGIEFPDLCEMILKSALMKIR